jgi:hypothetical protein
MTTASAAEPGDPMTGTGTSDAGRGETNPALAGPVADGTAEATRSRIERLHQPLESRQRLLVMAISYSPL